MAVLVVLECFLVARFGPLVMKCPLWPVASTAVDDHELEQRCFVIWTTIVCVAFRGESSVRMFRLARDEDGDPVDQDRQRPNFEA